MEPTYRIAQRLLARRAEVGVKQYGQDLTADSPGCMLVHALEEAADQVNYLLAEIQRRREALGLLIPLANTLEDYGLEDDVEATIALLGGRAALAQYDEILGVAEAAPAPRDEALDTVEMALRNIVAGSQNSFFVKDNAQAALDALSSHKDKATATDSRDEALRVATEALNEVVCWIPDGTRKSPLERGAKVETVHDLMQMITAAIRAAGGAR